MSKSAYFDKDAQDSLIKGLNLVANAVGATLGGAGNTVVIQRDGKSPIITKDGVSVAREINPKDERVKLGADLAISIASKQMNTCGDGTSSATVFGQALVNNGVRQIELANRNVNRTLVRKGLEIARDKTIKKLESYKHTIESNDELVNIATVSANGDRKLGKIVAEAYEKVGKAGVVLVEETKDRTIRLEFKEGMTFDRGWTSQFFVNKHETQSVEFDNPYVMLCNSKISNFSTLVNIIEPAIKSGKALVIIAESFDTAVTQGLAMNVLQYGSQMKIACIEAPGYGDRRLEILRDMAVYLGAHVGDDPMGVRYDAMSTADFGRCEKIIIKKNETIIRGGCGEEEALNARIASINGLIDNLKENDSYEREALGKRLAALTTGVAVIQVGGSSEEEIKELRDRLDDAQYAVKAALEEGYVPGSGVTLLNASRNLENEIISQDMSDDEVLGVKIFVEALKAPLRKILENAGVTAEIVMKEIFNYNDINYGFDVKALEYTDLLARGIIDPLKVVKGVVYAATSIASVVLTSSAIITEDPKEEKAGLSLNMMPSMM